METIVEISFDNAQQYLIDESFKRPVLIDFWADWCAPCKVLMPILQKLSAEYGGAFLLAKLNADQLGEIAAQFGVKSLPTVVLMKEGQPVDAFQGAQSEQKIREFLEKHLPKPWENALAKGISMVQEGKAAEALPILRQVFTDSGKAPTAGLALAEACLAEHFIDEAEQLLADIKMQDQGDEYKKLKAQLELMKESARSPAIQDLEAKLNEDPDNMQVAYELAVQLSQENHHREALKLLYIVLQQDRQFGGGTAKKIYLDILETLGKGNPLAIEFQRKIFTLLY